MELKPLALATCRALPELTEDDRVFVRALEAAGLSARPVVWDDPEAAWDGHCGVLIRSCWDYHLRLPDFEIWLENLERRCVPVWNSLETLRWNARKTYLRDCGAAGVPVVPTVCLPPGPLPDLDALLLQQGWDEAVLKPVVSAGAHGTVRLRRGETAAARAGAAEACAAHGAMVQPFLPEIEAEGEWSLVFVDGVFGHAVLKTPASGDFRVQEEHGGRVEARQAPDELVAAAKRALDAVRTPWLYARVDGVVGEGGFTVLELELLEPSLYFAQGEKTAARLAEAVRKRL